MCFFIFVHAVLVWDSVVELSSQDERSSPVKDGYGLRDAFYSGVCSNCGG